MTESQELEKKIKELERRIILLEARPYPPPERVISRRIGESL